MHQLFLFLIFHLLVFLFCLYVLCNDDTVLVRKNIGLEQTFNIAFFLVFVGLFSARLVYVIFHFQYTFLNPLAFLLFPYFPGLSLAGGVVGGSLFFAWYGRNKRLPTLRLFDFFAFSFFCTLSFGLLNMFLIERLSFLSLQFGILLLYIAAFVLFALVLLHMQQRKGLEDGKLGFLTLIVFSICIIAIHISEKLVYKNLFLESDDYLLIGLLVVSLVLLFAKEKIQMMLKNQK